MIPLLIHEYKISTSIGTGNADRKISLLYTNTHTRIPRNLFVALPAESQRVIGGPLTPYCLLHLTIQA